MLKNIVYLTLFCFLVPYLANNQPLFVSKNLKTAIYPVIPYGENQFFEGELPLPPQLTHPLGTDDRGRDLLVRLLYGFKNNFLFCISVSLIIICIAIGIGLGSVLFSSPWNSFLLLLMESTLFLPGFFILLAFLSVFKNQNALFIFCLLFYWAPAALLIRTEAVKILSKNYVLAAKVMGVKKWRLALFHILPNCRAVILTAFPMIFSSLFSLLAYVNYLGITSFEPSSSLGELLAEGRTNLQSTALVIAPLLAVLVPIFLLFPGKKSTDEFKMLQGQYVKLMRLGDFQRFKEFFGKKNRLASLIKLPQKMSWQR